MFATRVADYELMEPNEIARNIEENTYKASVRPNFNYAGMCEMIYDAHNVALKPHGKRMIDTAFGLSLFGSYHYYLFSPFNQVYFGLSIFSAFIFSLMTMNAGMSNQMSVVEMLVLPSRDIVRFLLMNGSIIETQISSVKFLKFQNTRLTYDVTNG